MIRIVINFAGLHQLRSIEEPVDRMPAEQGGTVAFENSAGRGSVPLPLNISPHTHYGAEFARMEAWLDENSDFAQDYFIRYDFDSVCCNKNITLCCL